MTRDQRSSTTETRATFVGVEVRLSRDGRCLLHFLVSGAVVCRPVEVYRALLERADVRSAVAPRRWPSAWLVHVPTVLRLALLAVVLAKTVFAGGVPASLAELTRLLTELLGESEIWSGFGG